MEMLMQINEYVGELKNSVATLAQAVEVQVAHIEQESRSAWRALERYGKIKKVLTGALARAAEHQTKAMRRARNLHALHQQQNDLRRQYEHLQWLARDQQPIDLIDIASELRAVEQKIERWGAEGATDEDNGTSTV